MDNFIVSARKYRPATFDMVVGQKSITTTLKNAIKNNHLAQAFLFCGPRGVGKTTCARILAKTINCEHVTENLEPCDHCESCVSFNQSATFNIFELDAASNNSVDDIRSLVDQVRIPPQMGKYKVYIIDEVHMLSTSAFNAFLKTLEEPPAYAKFILATTEKHKILPTILSRCQIFDFRRITVEDTVKYLQFVASKENVNADEEALHVVAQKAEGAMRDALSIFDQLVSLTGHNITYKDVIENLNVLDYDYYFKLIDYFLQTDITSTLLLINEIIENGFDEHYFIIGIGEHLRNLLVCKDAATAGLMEVSASIKERYILQANKCSQDFLLNALDVINKCDINFKSSNNRRLFLELSLIQICSILVNSQKKEVYESKISPIKEKEYTVSVTQPSRKAVASEPIPIPKPKEETLQGKKEEPLKKPAINRNLKGTGTISIKSELEDIIEKKDQKNGIISEPEAIYETRPSENFTQEQFEIEWNKFTESIAKESPSLYSTFKKRKPLLGANFMITIIIDNASQNDEINVIKAQILDFLRNQLNNYQIQLETKLADKKDEEKVYSPTDKFNKMVEINPALNQLKNQLNLEIDY